MRERQRERERESEEKKKLNKNVGLLRGIDMLYAKRFVRYTVSGSFIFAGPDF